MIRAHTSPSRAEDQDWFALAVAVQEWEELLVKLASQNEVIVGLIANHMACEWDWTELFAELEGEQRLRGFANHPP